MTGMIRRLFVLLLPLASACGPSQPSVSYAVDAVSKMRFVRHANGQCFGVVEFPTYGATGVSITIVPAELCPRNAGMQP